MENNKNIWIDPTEENITHYNEEFAKLLKEVNNLISCIEEITVHTDKLDFIGQDFDDDIIPIDYMLDFVDECDSFLEIVKAFRANFFSAGIDWIEAQRQLEKFFPNDSSVRERVRDMKSEKPFTQKIM